jgi:peptidoglycan/xylan/chitin deacetylase (PgdA/CDA1 family)/glycosyltransferase involved in cell wall biosynthesis
MSGRRPGDRAGPWLLLSALLGVLITSLALQGFTQHDIGRAGIADARGTAPVPGSIAYDDDRGVLRYRSLPPHTVALTFDDGPDPRWTPLILEELREAGVPATFFVVGGRAAEHPELVRAEIERGNEVGIHTYTHTDLGAVPRWRADLELSLTQLALEGAAGRTSALMRPPYLGTRDAVTARQRATISRVAAQGYVVALTDRDTEDWRLPGTAGIIHNGRPVGTAGEIVLMHDSGGDRRETVAALPALIKAYAARGYRFTTISGGLGAAPTAALHHVGRMGRLHGLVFLDALRLSRWVVTGLTWALWPLAILSIGRLIVVLALSVRHVRRRPAVTAVELPPVSVIVPAYNESVGIANAVRSLVASDYPDFEVIVVDDGSTDDTAAVVAGLGLDRVRVISQANAGKPAAINTGVGVAAHDIIVMVDGDTVFETGTLRALVAPLSDPRVGAVSGNTKVGNRHGILGRCQHLEYVVGFNLDRRMFDVVRCIPTIPGAIGAFRRRALLDVGGVSGDTLAEDTDLTMAINRAGWRVVYQPDARAWTEAPATLSALWRQRYRWCYGTLQAVWKHRRAVRDSGDAGRLGRFGLPYLLAFQVILPLLGPVIDVLAIYGLLFLSPARIGVYWLGFVAVQAVVSAYALRLDGESLRSLWAVPLQQFVYRQIMYLVVVQSVVSAVAGTRLGWHKLDRTGRLDAAPVLQETV